MTGDAPQLNLDWASGDVEALRAGYAAERAMYLADCPPDVEVEELRILGISGLLFTPPEGGAGAPILYFHGGGWSVGSPDTHRTLCACLARVTGRKVMSARYRLAPEHPFPAQKVDAVAALNAVLAGNVAGLGRPARVVLAGDSAGAAVALWAEAGARPAMRAAIEHVLCFYGAFGLRDSDSLRALGPSTPGLSQADVAAFYGHLGAALPADMIDSFLPAGAPLSLLVAGDDPLRDDSHALAARMRCAGRMVMLTQIDDMSHGALHMAGRSDAVARWLKTGVSALINPVSGGYRAG